MSVFKSSREEIFKAVAIRRLRTALVRKVPLAAYSNIRIGSHVLFYQDKSKTLEETYLVVSGDNKNSGCTLKAT